MEQKLVWGTGMISSRIGLGTWSLGGWMWGGSDDAAAIKTIRTALDGAVTSRIAVHSFDVVWLTSQFPAPLRPRRVTVQPAIGARWDAGRAMIVVRPLSSGSTATA
jgi:hypothetical protein